MRNEFKDAEATAHFGKLLGSQLKPGTILAFYGELGSGKTTLIKGIGRSMGIEERAIASPTFNYLNIYSGQQEIYHFDLYRLRGKEDFIEMGFEEYLNSQGICCIEWPERIGSLLPKRTIVLELSYASLTTRILNIKNYECNIC